jgi:agmatine deiminase
MSKEVLNSTPKQDGFRMPGEFEEHEGCWMIWPERTDNWRLGAKPAQAAFAEVAKVISKYESVTMAVSDNQYNVVRNLLPGHIKVVEMSSDDAWMRDVGPTFLTNDIGEIRAVDWRFNAWGGLIDGLYFPWAKDDRIARKVANIENIDYYSLDTFILEGGSIHVDGEGTAIVTEACLLDSSRNPTLSKEEVEMNLMEYLNVSKVIWLKNGIYLDETNEHVDNIIHYCAPGKVVLAWTDDESDPQYRLSNDAYDVLINSVDALGRKLEVIKLHIPNSVIVSAAESEGVDSVDGTLPRVAGDRQAASYANFYIANGAIILPIFGDDYYDDLAVKSLKKVFPTRVIETIYAREIILGGGNIHCITQQQPKLIRKG